MTTERRRKASSAGTDAARAAPGPTMVDVALEGVILRREPTRLGGVCTVSLVIAGREVEVIRDFADMIDHHVWAPGLNELLEKGQR